MPRKPRSRNKDAPPPGTTDRRITSTVSRETARARIPRNRPSFSRKKTTGKGMSRTTKEPTNGTRATVKKVKDITHIPKKKSPDNPIPSDLTS